MTPRLDLADDTFVVADPGAVAEAVRDRGAWSRWWPDLELTVTADRGVEGVRWSVAGALVGSMEIWLEPWADGVLVHWYLRAADVRRPPVTRRARPPARSSRSAADRRARAWKQHALALKDRLEAGRIPGDSAAPVFRDPPASREPPAVPRPPAFKNPPAAADPY